jgi:hypothetical protein
MFLHGLRWWLVMDGRSDGADPVYRTMMEEMRR